MGPPDARRGLAACLLGLAAVTTGAGCTRADGAFQELPGRVLHGPTGLVLVQVPGGTYLIGSPPDERERDRDEHLHEVELEPFLLAETETTVALWRAVMDREPPGDPPRDDLPVSASWHEAQEFLRRLNELHGGGWRLPTEAEWEVACRAGTTTPFSFGENVLPAQANFDDRRPYAHAPGQRSAGLVPVRSLPPNPWGLHEMHGNVREWCADLYVEAHGTPKSSAPAPGAARVVRGGDLFSRGDQLRSAYRDGYAPNTDGLEYGFRLARSVP